MKQIIEEMNRRAGVLWKAAENPKTLQEDAVLMRGKARAYEEVVEYLECLDPSLCTIMSVMAKVNEIEVKAEKAGLLCSFHLSENSVRFIFWQKVGDYNVGERVKELENGLGFNVQKRDPVKETCEIGALLEEAEAFVDNWKINQQTALEGKIARLSGELKIARAELREAKKKGGAKK